MYMYIAVVTIYIHIPHSLSVIFSTLCAPCSDHLLSFLALGVSACQSLNDMHRYTPEVLAMNRTGMQLIGEGRTCLSMSNVSGLPLSSTPQPPLPGPEPLQEPLLQGHADHSCQQQDTPPACDTPTPPPGPLYHPQNCSTWPPLCSTGLQPPPRMNEYSEDVSPSIQPTDAVVDLARPGEDIESSSSGLQSPSSKGSLVSSMECRGAPCTPLCLATSHPSSEPAANSDTSVNAPQEQGSPHPSMLGNQQMGTSTTLPTFSHMAPIPQFSMSNTAGIHRNANSSFHPVYFTNFQFVAGSSDRIKSDPLLTVGHGPHPFASSDLHSLPPCGSPEHFSQVGGTLQSGLVSPSHSMGAVDTPPWALASCKKRLLSPGIEEECDMNSDPCSAGATEPQEKQPRLTYQSSSVGVPSNGCLWTPLYVANYPSQLQHYSHPSTLLGHNSPSPMQHQLQSCPLTSTSDYPQQIDLSGQPTVMYNLHVDKTAPRATQGAGSVQCEASVTGSNEAVRPTSAAQQLSQWALHMTKGTETGSRLQVMPAFGLLPTYNGLGSVGTSARNC